jgi:NADH-quinone oxidoreductase subunit M
MELLTTDILPFLVLWPLALCFVLLFCKGKMVRRVSLSGSLIQVLLALLVLRQYNQHRVADKVSPFLLESNEEWFRTLHIHYHIGVDGISMVMILLTAFVVLAGVLVSWRIESLTTEFFLQLMLLSAGAYGFFISLDLFTMFFFLEISVIPKFMLIGIWGSGRKEYSAMKLALMLMGGSALVFVGIIGQFYGGGAGHAGMSSMGSGSFDLLAISKMHLPFLTQKIFFPFLFVGFGIFGALFPFHTWVPDGHSSAPTAGSMFLAGISMKLGGYGCLRVAAFLMPEAAHIYAPYIIVLATIAIIYGAFATMMQTDLKYINAYSSVSHCGFVLLGIGMLTRTAALGAVLQMVSHGLMTALFFAAIGMVYDRTHTRKVADMGGLLKVAPFLSTGFVIAGLCSLGLPGFSGFVAEMTVFMGSWQHADFYYRLATVLACASIVVTAVYILRAVGQVIMGPLKVPGMGGTASFELRAAGQQELPGSGFIVDATWYERGTLILLIIGIVLIGVAPFCIAELVRPGVDNIISPSTMTGFAGK